MEGGATKGNLSGDWLRHIRNVTSGSWIVHAGSDWLPRGGGDLIAGAVCAAVRRDMGQATKVTGPREGLGLLPTGRESEQPFAGCLEFQ